MGDRGQSELLLKSGGSTEDGNLSYFVGARRSTSDVYLEAPSPVRQDLGNHGELLSFLFRRQDLVFIGQELSSDRIKGWLDEALLTDAEMAQGPDLWIQFEDPLPAWL